VKKKWEDIPTHWQHLNGREKKWHPGKKHKDAAPHKGYGERLERTKGKGVLGGLSSENRRKSKRGTKKSQVRKTPTTQDTKDAL